MKQKETTHVWKKSLSLGLSLAMTLTLLPTAPAYAAPAAGSGSAAAETPTLTKAGSVAIPSDGSTKTVGQPFAAGTAGSNLFRIPTVITMNNGEILAIADARYTDSHDGYGIDTIASVSSDFGSTWNFGFPYMFSDSYKTSTEAATFIDPGLIEGPDGTLYLIGDAFPAECSTMSGDYLRPGTGFVEIDGEKRLVLTDKYSNATTEPTKDNADVYPYYVGDFKPVGEGDDLFARIYKRSDNSATEYGVDEWYNLYHVNANGEYVDDLKQSQIGGGDAKVQQNVYYKHSILHIYSVGHLWCITSTDHGRTWSHPKDITPQVKKDDDKALLVSPGHGIATSDGTIAIGAYKHPSATQGVPDERACIIYSKDNGLTWERTDDIPGQSSEDDIVELENGTLRMFYRHTGGQIRYADFKPKADGSGYDVQNPVSMISAGINSSNNVTAISYSRKINGKQAILYACSGGSGRTNGRIYTFLVNDDANNTMELYNTFSVPNSATGYHYSSITELPDGSIGLLWENTGTSILFSRFDILTLVPNAAVEGAYVSLDFDEEHMEPYTTTYAMSAEAPETAMSQADPEIATAATSDGATYYTYPTYDHNSNVSGTPRIDTSKVSYRKLSDAEFTFAKGETINNDTKWIISTTNGEKKYLTMGSSGADTMIATSSANMTVRWTASSNTARISAVNNATYVVFFDDNETFNRSATANQAHCNYEMTLWKKSDEDPNSAIKGYAKYTGSELAEGSYLITYENTAGIHFIHPTAGQLNQTKQIAKGMTPNKMLDRTVTITPKEGANGTTKAKVDGITYNIRVRGQVEDDYEYMLVGDTITLPSPYSKEDAEAIVTKYQSDANFRAKIVGFASGGTPLFAHTSDTAGSVSSFNATSDNSIQLEDAELLFTKKENGKWTIWNEAKSCYFTSHNGAEHFEAAAREPGVTIESFDDKDNTYYISGDRYLVFYTPSMTMNGWNGKGGNAEHPDYVRYGMTLLEKTGILSKNDVLPGYIKATEPEDGKTYLITYIWEDSNGKEHVFVLYPLLGSNAANPNSYSKYAALTEPSPLYAHDTGNGDIATYNTNVNRTTGINLSKAEFIITKNATIVNQYEVKNVTAYANPYYLTVRKGYFTSTKTEVFIETADMESKGVEIHTTQALNGSNDNRNGWISLHKPWRAFGVGTNKASEANGGSYLDLLKKNDSFSKDDVLPGYTYATEIKSGETYLIAKIGDDGAVCILYPSNTDDSISTNGAYSNSKLAYKSKMVVTLTATAEGETTYEIGDETHKVRIRANAECTHNGAVFYRNQVDVDHCHYISGNTGDKYCALCGKFLEAGTVTPALGHDWDEENAVYVAPTKTTNGSITSKCKRDPSHTNVVIVPANAYKALADAIEKAAKMLGDDKDLYGVDSTALQTAYNTYKNADKDLATSQLNSQQMTQIASQLRGAMNPLTNDRNKLEERWNALYKEADAITQKEIYGTDWTAFTSAKGAVTNVATTSYAALTTAIGNLEAAMAKLQKADKKQDLLDVYNQYKDLTQGDYTNGTWGTFDDARQKAKDLLEAADPDLSALSAAKEALENAHTALRTNAQEAAERQVKAPASVSYTAPAADAYPTDAVVLSSVDDKASSVIVDRTNSPITKKDEGSTITIENKNGIWSFHDQVMSSSDKYDVTGDGNAMVIALKFYLGTLNSNTSEILGKGDQYALRIENRKLVMTVGADDSKATESIDLTTSMRNKWHDIVMLVDGKGNQHLYLDGVMSETVSGAGSAVLISDASPFTLGYNAKVDGNELPKTIGRFGDVKFYHGTVELPTDYTALTSVLAGNPPAAYITVAPYTAATAWTDAAGKAVAAGQKFAAKTVYKATTTLKTTGDLEFPTTDAFKTAVKEAVATGSEGTTNVVVSVSDTDTKTMTIEVTYPATGDIGGGSGEEPGGDPAGDDTAELTKAKADIADALKKAEDLVKAGQGAYTKDSWDAFMLAYTNANNGKDGADAAAIKALTEALTKAQTGLALAIKVGDYVDVKNIRYIVTDPVNQTVTAGKVVNKKKLKTANIPATVTINNVVCKVTDIKAGTFKKCTKLKKVTINANVTSIGNKAFMGCKKLKNVILKGAKLTSVGKASFKKTPANIKLKMKKLSSADKKAIKKLFGKSGINKKAIK